MATRDQIEATYDYMDLYWRASMGEHADMSCAMYDGDYDKSLAKAQSDKHEYILRQTGFVPGARVLDIGCGWGGFLSEVRSSGGRGLGLTLSSRQAQACWRAGLDVQILDWREADAQKLGCFDSIVSVGAFEHFCSEESYVGGRQGDIYRDFFELCHQLLRAGGRMFLQTMLWGRVPRPAEISLSAPSRSDAYALALLRKFYPGSWLPSSLDQIAETAAPRFSIVSSLNGRQDYVHTMEEWGKSLRRLTPWKLAAAICTTRYLFLDRDFRYRLKLLRSESQLECFRRGVIDHERIVLEKQAC